LKISRKIEEKQLNNNEIEEYFRDIHREITNERENVKISPVNLSVGRLTMHSNCTVFSFSSPPLLRTFHRGLSFEETD
jgi:hypothetical protein